jgi:hypothetical protein
MSNGMKKTKKSILASIAIFAMVAMAMPVFAASGDRDLPGENSPFWEIFAQMVNPTDTNTCIATATTYVNSQNFSDEQKQGEISGYTQMCREVANMPSEMESEMAAEGVTSNLFAASDWHHVNNLFFEKAGQGKIQFTNTIDFMSYRFMTFMSDFRSMVKFDEGYISLNASMVTDMKYYGAQLTMFGLDFPTTPDIYVTDANGTTMHKATDSDISGVNYDPITGGLTFNTTHFSAFRSMAKGSRVKAMKISSVSPKSIKYNSQKNTLKFTVKGKNFYKKGSDVSCTLGFERAEKVQVARSGKKVTCTFAMSNFSTLGLYPVSIMVGSTGEVSKANAVRIR